MTHNLHKTKLGRNKPVEADFAQVFQLHNFCLFFDFEKQLKPLQASLVDTKKTDAQV